MSDIAKRGGAKERIGQRVKQHVGVRMPRQASLRLNFDSAQHQAAPVREGMDVIPNSCANHRVRALRSASTRTKIGRIGDLDIAGMTRHDAYRLPERLDRVTPRR